LNAENVTIGMRPNKVFIQQVAAQVLFFNPIIDDPSGDHNHGPFYSRILKMVAPGRIELPRPCGHWILSPARLPIPPQGHRNRRAGNKQELTFEFKPRRFQTRPPCLAEVPKAPIGNKLQSSSF
jgi:hypothetical protein